MTYADFEAQLLIMGWVFDAAYADRAGKPVWSAFARGNEYIDAPFDLNFVTGKHHMNYGRIHDTRHNFGVEVETGYAHFLEKLVELDMRLAHDIRGI